MSPEQASGGALDGRSDLFSVGILAWELFTGSRPFDGESDLQTLDRLRFHDPGSLGDQSTDAPPEIVDVVDRLLSKDPSLRPATAAEAIVTLKGLFLRRGHIVSSREVATWVEEVLSSLPESLREHPISALSLEEALLLPMGGTHNPKTDTVSMIDASGSALGVGELSTSASWGSGRLPSSDELSASPSTLGPRRRRGRLVVLLVGLNLLLLGSVALLVWQQSASLESNQAPQVPTSIEGQRAPKPAGTLAPFPQQNPTFDPALTDEIPLSQSPSAPPATQAPALPAPRAAPSATSVKSRSPGRASAGVHGRRGRVVFRFYPASSKVHIDGRALATGSSNVVSQELDAGRHRLLLVGPEGVRRSETFEVKPGKTTNLTTLHVTAR
jgi:serine/threonine protein kinase